MATMGSGKFSKRAKLFFANYPNEGFNEANLVQLCSQFGDVGDCFMGKGFAFVVMDYRHNAELAKTQLGKLTIPPMTTPLDVRWAASNCCLKVENLHSSVSNEILHESFSQFGEVERAVVVVDAQKRVSKGYGYVELVNSQLTQRLANRLQKEFLILPGSPVPVKVGLTELEDEDVGMPESR
eukprot:gene20761-24884_t